MTLDIQTQWLQTEIYLVGLGKVGRFSQKSEFQKHVSFDLLEMMRKDKKTFSQMVVECWFTMEKLWLGILDLLYLPCLEKVKHILPNIGFHRENFIPWSYTSNCCEVSQLMVNCWFGARWFGILGHPSNNPFHKGNPSHRAPNQQLTISWVSWLENCKHACPINSG